MHAIYVHDTQLAHPKFSRAKSYARSRTPQNSQNMGGIVSNPLDDAKRQEIQDTVEELVRQSVVSFAVCAFSSVFNPERFASLLETMCDA